MDASGPEPAIRLKPFHRPPMAKLVIMDDGGESSGEVYRMRKPEVIIGRSIGDVLIEHDLDVSSKHVTIARQAVDGRYRWRLIDANSTNGTFIRVNKATLASDKELLIGGGRFKVQITTAKDEPSEDFRTTRVYASDDKNDSMGSLVLTNVRVPELRYEYSVRGGTLGRDPRCDVAIPNDPYLCPTHARFERVDNRWVVNDLGSTNGLWVRVDAVWLDQDAEFQIGEQRIHFIIG
jgi:pSer/pThr/pTyr-binding forkhead associated (FHA) protein